MLKLNQHLEGKNRYCGPAALAGIFGVCTDTAAAMIRRVSGQRMVKGSYMPHVIQVIHEHGGTTQHRPECTGRPVWKVAKGRDLTLMKVECDGYFSGHFVLVRRGKVLDSFSRRWVPVRKHYWRNARILRAVEIVTAPKKGRNKAGRG